MMGKIIAAACLGVGCHTGGGVEISSDIPAGNIIVQADKGNVIELAPDYRDTEGGWFYWSFAAKFNRPGDYTFRFNSPNKIGPRGPAFSFDDGKTWQFLSPDKEHDSQEFTYSHTAGKPEKVIFCMGMQYLQKDFQAFTAEFAADKNLKISELCRSRKGRAVELVQIKEGNPPLTILLTSRHHAGEMMATHALEGILRAALADDDTGRKFRRLFTLYAVPFADKDGVEDGDQGKNRRPHDHARDYAGTSIYPETAALRQLLDRVKPQMVFDLHCPWIRGGANNETIYMVGSGKRETADAMDVFSAILERNSTPGAPYFSRNNVPFGTSWNTGNNYTQGFPIRTYAERLEYVKCAQTIEIPFANCEKVTLSHEAMLQFGAALVKSFIAYAEKENLSGRADCKSVCE